MTARTSLQWEQAVLGAVLLDPTALVRVRPLAGGADAFAHAHHRTIWAAMLALDAAGEPIDLVSLAAHLNARDRLLDIGGMAYLADLADNTPSAVNAEHYAREVAKDARRRRTAAELQGALERLEHDDADQVRGELQAALARVETDTGGTFGTLDLIDLGFNHLAGGDSVRDLVPTGFAPLDDMLGGFEPGRLYVVAARTGAGKSALVLQSFLALATAGHPVGLCSLEMPAREIIVRLFAHRYGLNLTRLTRRYGNIAIELDERYQSDPMSGIDLHVDDTSTELPALIARGLEWHHRHRIRAVFVDYIGLVQVRGNAPRHEKIGEASRAFKQLAKRLEIPVIVACQFNRDADKDDRRPRLSDLRDSGNVEQDADAVIAINPLSDPDANGLRSIEIGVLKNRSGSTGWLRESITFDGRTQRFESGTVAETA